MKILVVVALALQLVYAENLDFQKCGSCECYVGENRGTWPWPVKNVAKCEGATEMFPDPDDLPADLEILYIVRAGGNITTLEEDQFILYKGITGISIEESHIEKLDEHTFRNIPTTVTEISFSRNLFTEIPTGVFSYASNVVTIGLTGNKLRVLQANLFSNLHYLKKIDLNDNEITLIEENCFVNLSSLEEIRLSNNKMHTLSLNIMDNDLNTLKYFSLDGNPWNCDDTLCMVMDVFNKYELWGALIPTCKTPGNLRGMYWNKIKHVAQLSFTPNSMSVFEKDNVTLECKHCFTSQLRWTLDGRELPINYQQISKKSRTSKLTIEKVNKNQQGEYRCYIKDCYDCDMAGLYLEVKEIPKEIVDSNTAPLLSNNKEISRE